MAFVSLGPSLPSVEITVDFANDPTSSTRTWTDITPYVREFSTKRGRSDALARPEAGTLDLVLQNDDRRFDPSYTSGPYYPNLLPMRRIRVRAQWASVTYNVYYGFVQEWTPSYSDDNRQSLVHASASDAFVVLNLTDLGGQSYSAENSGTRAANVLDFAGFGTADRTINSGQSSMVASGTFSAGSDALSHLLDVMASENGLLVADAGGTIVWQDRHFRAKNKNTASGTIGTGATMIGYNALNTAYGAADVWNIVKVTANGGTVETATNTASTASYYQRMLAHPPGGTYLVSSQAEALAAAQYMLGLYKQPALRIPEVAAIPAGATANWGTVLAVDLSDRMALSHIPPGGGTITGDKYIESVAHHVSFERTWETRFLLSPTSTDSWILGVSTLGETTMLGY